MRRKRLIDARKASGKTQEQIAEFVGVDRTTLGKWERGESTPQPTQRERYAEAVGVSMRELDAMISGVDPGAQKMPEWLTTYLGMEQSAETLRAHEPRAIYGLVQTVGYLENLVSTVGISGVSGTYLQRTIDQRLYRQKRVRNGDMTLDLIQTESTLHLRIGNSSVMEEQLRVMAELAELPNVTIRITRFDAGQYEALRLGDFAIMTHPWGSQRVHLEGYGGGQSITDPEEVAYFSAAYEHACRVALSPSESLEFILERADRWSKE
ncbi:helix-turn-helix transcriptional regulator [Nocardia sp. CDC186]|uniref:Helix-turn-helix transcriptional regulator n=1 Tax=Nocardia implantans TaxID=3108168 RepID=A0ABU6B2M1_9NOCA|nr:MULTISPECIES: Scr1 family TA system antitoxin-like transcriptional regulator [unclassified Nocardia]MBF6195001.1 helix-turn-helix transcriptional regulator [Nocardia beijingensis]MEA3530338.1 helix-turn-helix transcriptional regulator [Nocardia sp. CDC192]MEB3513802.1 helix-turn-helix transcriptional regulator [Nocardia sp. CDC186]